MTLARSAMTYDMALKRVTTFKKKKQIAVHNLEIFQIDSVLIPTTMSVLCAELVKHFAYGVQRPLTSIYL